MLDNKVRRAGTLLFKGGRIYVDGWELAEDGMCREHVIFACLYVAQELHRAALANIAEGGGAKNTCADMPPETPREWLCPSSEAFHAMLDGSAPDTSDDARDAARYRFMRGRLHSLTIRTGRLESNLTSYGLIETAEEADRYVDLEMSRSGPRKSGDVP